MVCDNLSIVLNLLPQLRLRLCQDRRHFLPNLRRVRTGIGIVPMARRVAKGIVTATKTAVNGNAIGTGTETGNATGKRIARRIVIKTRRRRGNGRGIGIVTGTETANGIATKTRNVKGTETKIEIAAIEVTRATEVNVATKAKKTAKRTRIVTGPKTARKNRALPLPRLIIGPHPELEAFRWSKRNLWTSPLPFLSMRIKQTMRMILKSWPSAAPSNVVMLATCKSDCHVCTRLLQ